MSRTELVEAAPTRAWPMYRAMVGIGVLCGLLIVTAYQITLPIIERNKAEALQRAIFRVLPEARSSATFVQVDEDRFELLEGGGEGRPLVHAGYDEAGELVGFAIDAHGMGYQDVIRVLYGYAFRKDAIVGLVVLESKETPGLGDKIESDDAFRENFRRLDVSLGADGRELSHPIEFVKPGTREHPWQIDGITGATISSTAVAGILEKSSSHWIPRLHRRLAAFGRKDAE